MYFIKSILQHLKYIKYDYIKYCILNIFGTLIEVAGIISIFPLISFLNDKLSKNLNIKMIRY